MKKILALTCFAVLHLQHISAQLQINWAISEGGSTNDFVSDICSDANGNIVKACRINNSNPAFLVKHDASGNVLWSKNDAGGIASPSRVCTDGTGNVFACGAFSAASLTFETTTLTNASAPSTDAFIVKYDASGNFIWAISFGGSGNEGCGISADAAGNFYLALNSRSNTITINGISFINTGVSTNECYLIKGDPLGNIIWVKTHFGTSDDTFTALATDALGNTYASGTFVSDTITIGSGAMTLTNNDTTGSGSIDFYIVKYDSSGNLIWTQQAAGGFNERIVGLNINSNGDIAITGQFSSNSLTFGNLTLSKPFTFSNSCLTAKLDSSGTLLWLKYAGDDATPQSIGIDSAGIVYSIGNFGTSFTIGTFNFTNSGTGQDIYIVHYDINGNETWANSYGSNLDDYPAEILVSQSGEISFAGNFKGNSINLGTTTLTNAGTNTYDVFLASSSSTATGLTNSSTNYTSKILAFPNPVNEILTIVAPTTSSNSEYIIVDTAGRIMSRGLLNGEKTTVDVQSLSAGIYFLKTRSYLTNTTIKLVKE
jgi:hypothetical protein